jgi:hypothetical protein
MKPLVFLMAFFLCGVVVYALWYKGNVKAVLKIPFIEFSLETTDKNPLSKPGEVPQIKTATPPSKPELAPGSHGGAPPP